MRCFRRLADGIDVRPLLDAVSGSDLWDQFPIRTQHPESVHHDVSDILARFDHDGEVQAFPAWSLLPALRPLVFDLMRAVEGVELGRVVISRLAPGKAIGAHVDGGVDGFSRYQIALQSDPGCLFRAGDETASFREGEIWWFDNRLEHEVLNHSEADRIVVIVDVRRA